MKQLQRLTSLCIKSPKQQHSIDYATDNKGLPGVYMYQYHRAVKMGRRERERGRNKVGKEEEGKRKEDKSRMLQQHIAPRSKTHTFIR